ncbi:hypothetical protein [Chryseolinea lacunae]|uniref:Beta-lactamase-inhibitor-like PepSY-like domain-containing protein n=1 Tax=Chryseolinea lacunae TaxID=2801331 RepID=A0ABS1KYC0_9BACT|nr:hypothetical protein [Chryseolinea lacunae]MBL0744438.1 hypothetical protein [Chryseolinea lacunae]
MKKIMLFAAGMLFVGTAATFAQIDTTKTQRNGEPRVQPAPPEQQQPAPQQSQNYSNDATKGMTQIKTAEIPASLRQTLQSPEYKGWETNSTIYKSDANSGYTVQMMNQGGQPQTYRFDDKGKLVPNPKP